MSAVKEILREQDQNFISLYDLLVEIKAANKCTLSEAATVLIRLLNKTKTSERPSLYTNTFPLGMERTPWGKNAFFEKLEFVALNGNFEMEGDNDVDDLPF